MEDVVFTQTVYHTCKILVVVLETWKGGFKVVGIAHKAAEGGRHHRKKMCCRAA